MSKAQMKKMMIVMACMMILIVAATAYNYCRINELSKGMDAAIAATMQQ